ncbi:MAG: response regulator [Candidatus Omnitrophota bacterium]
MECKNINVMVVDDEADFRELLTFWLQSKGYSVIPADTAEAAVRLAKEKKPDIIFMDLRMPGVDGVEAIQRIRKFDKDVPIIVISAHLDNEKAKLTCDYGISGIFYKGEDFKEGLALLEATLRTHKKLKKNRSP